MLNIKEIKPIGSQVLVTENIYGYDDENAAGIIINKKGDIKDFQQVVAVGDDVKFVKPGDWVKINFYKYAVFKEDPNSVKAMADNPIVGLRLNEIEMVDPENENEVKPFFLIDCRDIQYILTNFEEVKYAKDDTLITIPKPKLILPSNRIKA